MMAYSASMPALRTDRQEPASTTVLPAPVTPLSGSITAPVGHGVAVTPVVSGPPLQLWPMPELLAQAPQDGGPIEVPDLATLHIELGARRRQIDRLETQNGEYLRLLRNLEGDSSDLNRLLSSEKQQFSAFDTEKEQLRTQISTLRDTLDTQEDAMQQQEAELRRYRGSKDAVDRGDRDALPRLADGLGAAPRLADGSSAAKYDAREEKTTLGHNAGHLQQASRITELEDASDRKAAHISKLEDENSRHRALIVELESQLTGMSRQLRRSIEEPVWRLRPVPDGQGSTGDHNQEPMHDPTNTNLGDDAMDVKLRDYLEQHSDFELAIEKVSPGWYVFGKPVAKKVYLKQAGKNILARVGGGYKDVVAWLDTYRDKDGEEHPRTSKANIRDSSIRKSIKQRASSRDAP